MARDEAYLLAEKKIQEALKSGATELDLGGMKLTKLPESIGQLTQLKKLHLSPVPGMRLSDINQLPALPESLGQLVQLIDLNLSSNQLKVLPESLGQLTQLTVLDLSSNQLTTLPESIGRLTHLQKINISANKLVALPSSLRALRNLRLLDIHSNQFELVPEWIGELSNLEWLNVCNNKLDVLPNTLGQLSQLKALILGGNTLKTLPNWISNLKQLQNLDLFGIGLEVLPNFVCDLTTLKEINLVDNQLTSLPSEIGQLVQLERLTVGFVAGGNPLSSLPESIGDLSQLRDLTARKCGLTSLPFSLTKLQNLESLDVYDNHFNPELTEACEQGAEAVKLYLRAGPVIPSYEAKLILVGEGEVGKTCLMDALLNKEWQEHPSTHGIEIQSVKMDLFFQSIKMDYFFVEENEDSDEDEIEEDNDERNETLEGNTGDIYENIVKEITLNGWDFGGQRVYRPTHQLFFSAPAVYLVVWKPREGPQQGFVKEWIQLVKRREPSAKIIVVATHGGPQQRQPDIDRQELWDLFGKETVIDFFFVDSKPDEHGHRKGIAELKEAIVRVAATLPEVGRSVPKSFADVRAALQATGAPYLSFDEVLAICHAHNMDDEIARLFITISHRLGHLTHYENDPALRDIVILRPDWLATAMSYVLDDEETRKAHGLVKFSRLSQLWNDPSRPAETRYPKDLHEIFLRLMERFDLSYRVAGLSGHAETDPESLIAQLVPDNRPEGDLAREWVEYPNIGNLQQVQICRIVDKQTGQSATAEGLFYQLIVRLHKYSLGRVNFSASVHWQRGLIIEDEYKSRAFLEYVGNEVRITVRAPYPEGFLGMLTREVKYLVDSFWEGLRCDVMVPCIEPCGRNAVGIGLYEVEKLIDSKRRSRNEFPCPVCIEWQNIDSLLRNAPAAARPISLESLQIEFSSIKDKLNEVNSNTLRVLSQVDKSYNDLLQVLTDEAKEGPRLFSLFPLDRSAFNPKEWIREKFRLVLWCEHSRLPLPALNNGNMKKGVYDLDLDREWFKKATPYLKFLSGTLSIVLPVASSAVNLALDDKAYKLVEEQLDFGKNVIGATIGEMEKIGEFLGAADASAVEHGVAVHAENATLRELHALLKAKDPGFGGLIRVLNKRNEFLWVHDKFASEY